MSPKIKTPWPNRNIGLLEEHLFTLLGAETSLGVLFAPNSIFENNDTSKDRSGPTGFFVAPPMKKDKPNENRQKAFVREYLKDKNGKQAAIRAGYSKSGAEVTASRLLRKSKVKEALEKHEQKAEEKAIVDLAYVLTGFKEIADRCRQSDTFDAAGANKALECLGKHLGAFIEKHELKVGFKLEDLLAGANKIDEEDRG